MSFLDVIQTLAIDPAAPLDIAEVALLFAGEEYPDLDHRYYLRQVDQLALDAATHVQGDLENRVAGLGYFLFELEGFSGNDGDYYDPRNSYLSDVLDRRLGIPISLSVLAMAVGDRLGMTIQGVGLPGHFIAKAVEGDQEVLFDPFHGGQSLTPAACAALVEAATGQLMPLDDVPFEAVPLGAIVARMLNNLKGIYLKRETYPRAIRVMERLHLLEPDDLLQRRDLGVALVRAERFGAAIDHLLAYLEKSAQVDDKALVQSVLQQAKREVSRWN